MSKKSSVYYVFVGRDGIETQYDTPPEGKFLKVSRVTNKFEITNAKNICVDDEWIAVQPKGFGWINCERFPQVGVGGSTTWCREIQQEEKAT